MAELTDISEQRIDTPFGDPSDAIIIGTLNGVRVAFLPRHGRGHVHIPSTVPYRANIYALKLIGVERIISVSACGSLREDYAPGHVVVPDQLYDNTRGARGNTFFGDGLVAHISVADPFCNDLSHSLVSATERAGGQVHQGGSFITIEGPRFSTKAESNVFRSWGMSLVGMTTSPEAFLAREAGICYAVMAHVTDYDVWHESEEPVTVEMVIKTLNSNLALAQTALTYLIPEIVSEPRMCACQHTLATAVITDRSKIPEATRNRIAPIIKGFVS
jgi:5'-methylthioadenosine phosphorylase